MSPHQCVGYKTISFIHNRPCRPAYDFRIPRQVPSQVMACAAEAENHGQALDDTHYRIRQLTEEDIPIVATICYEVR